MRNKVLKLKQLAVSYLAALEWDYCPEEDKASEVKELIETTLTQDEVAEGLINNSGRRPDEIALEMAEFIKTDL